MNPIQIDNGYFTRPADPAADADLLREFPGQEVIRQELGDEEKERMDFYIREMAISSAAAINPQMYERASLLSFLEVYETLFVTNNWGFVVPRRVIPADQIPLVKEMIRRREALVPVGKTEADVWPVWGEHMPHENIREEGDWRYSYDTPDFRPFLVPCLQDDQANVPGNLIIVSGGAYDWRSNRWEGLEAVPRFYAMGYNCFLLQRRVRPYLPEDGALDLQRSIRFLRANAERLGIGAADRIIVNGYSGGGWCIMDMLAGCRKDSSPVIFDEAYQPDAADAFPSNVSAALIAYGAGFRSEEYRQAFLENPDLPPLFFTAGQEDFAQLDLGSLDVYRAVRDRVPAELHIYAGVPHGYGVGICEDHSDPEDPKPMFLAEVAGWPDAADRFLKRVI